MKTSNKKECDMSRDLTDNPRSPVLGLLSIKLATDAYYSDRIENDKKISGNDNI